MKKVTLSLLALLLMGATAVKAQPAQPDFDDKYATELVKAGTAAPDFKMKTPDGKNFQFSKFAKGKTVVLDFWASWCPDCRKDAARMRPRWCVCMRSIASSALSSSAFRWTPMWRRGRKPSRSLALPIRR